MPFDVMDDDQQEEQQYQDENGFRLPVPAGGGGGAAARPVKTASNPAPVEGMHIPGAQPNGGDDAVKQAMMASSTRMPQAPPQDEQLSNLIQQRQRTGQPLDRTNPKYKRSFGNKFLGTVANALTGFSKPGSAPAVDVTGPNRAYYRDEADRQAQAKNLDTTIANREKLDESNRKGFDSAVKQAYESRIADSRDSLSRARQSTADAQQQTADVRQQLADEQSRSITYDAKAKRFMKNGKIYVPKTIEEGASLEAGNGVQGYYTKLWSQQRKNNSNSLGDELARERMEEQRQKNLSGVQKDIDSAVTRHKAGLQKRFDALQFKVDTQEIDPKTPEGAKAYNDAMAGIERDDYKGMTTLGQQFADRTKRFGETVEAPKPQPWTKSYLPEDERARLIGGKQAPSESNPVKAAPPSVSQHKVGDIVKIKGQSMRIVGVDPKKGYQVEPAR